jgi:hypothetical protein
MQDALPLPHISLADLWETTNLTHSGCANTAITHSATERISHEILSYTAWRMHLH